MAQNFGSFLKKFAIEHNILKNRAEYIRRSAVLDQLDQLDWRVDLKDIIQNIKFDYEAWNRERTGFLRAMRWTEPLTDQQEEILQKSCPKP